MKDKPYDINENDIPQDSVNEEAAEYSSREELEEARLREAVHRSDMEKFRLFTRMMRIGMMLKRAKITHHPS